MPTETAQQIVDGLTREGYLVDLNVSKWAGQTRLAESDLGLEGLTDKNLHRLGRRNLVPHDEIAKLTAVESRARVRLAESSYAFPFGGARFVPAGVMGNLLADLDGLRSEFDAKVQEFCASYETMANEQRAAFMDNAVEIKVKLAKDDAWLEAFEQRLSAAYPTTEDVREAFAMEWSLYQFALPKGLHVKVIDAHHAMQAARLADEARRKIEDDVQRFVGEAAVDLRRRAADLARHVANMVQRSGDRISEKTLNPLRDLIDQFKAMDFTGDVEFGATLADIRTKYLSGSAAENMRQDADFREAFGKALDHVVTKATAESEKAAQDAMARFLKFGSMGRAVAI